MQHKSDHTPDLRACKVNWKLWKNAQMSLLIGYIYYSSIVQSNANLRSNDFIKDLTMNQTETKGSPVKYKIQERTQVDQAK